MNLRDLAQIAATDAKAALMLARESNRMKKFGADEAAQRDALSARECISSAATALRVVRAMRDAGYVDRNGEIVLA